MYYKNILKPEYLTLPSLGVFFVAWVTPESIYSSIINEPSYVSGSLLTLVFVLTLTIAFWFGCKIRFSPSRESKVVLSHQVKKIKLPISTTTLILAAGLFLYLKENYVLILSNIIGSASAIKNEAEIPSLLMPIIYAHTAVFNWYYSVRRAGKDSSVKVDSYEYAAMCVLIATSILLVSRYILLPFLFGLIMLEYREKKVKIKELVIILMGVSAIFSVLGLLRGGEILSQMYGYGPASFNRLTALLLGYTDLIEADPLRYIASTLGENKPYIDLLIIEHDAVGIAGLDWGLNWFTVYGYIYAATGMFAHLYFFILGIITKEIYRRFYRNEILGVVLYPWVAITIVLWFSSNMLAWGATSIFVITALIIKIYNMLILSWSSKKPKYG